MVERQTHTLALSLNLDVLFNSSRGGGEANKLHISYDPLPNTCDELLRLLPIEVLLNYDQVETLVRVNWRIKAIVSVSS